MEDCWYSVRSSGGVSGDWIRLSGEQLGSILVYCLIVRSQRSDWAFDPRDTESLIGLYWSTLLLLNEKLNKSTKFCLRLSSLFFRMCGWGFSIDILTNLSREQILFCSLFYTDTFQMITYLIITLSKQIKPINDIKVLHKQQQSK